MNQPMDEIELKNGLENLSVLLGFYFRALVAAGFTRDEALVLARDWQSYALHGTGERGDE